MSRASELLAKIETAEPGQEGGIIITADNPAAVSQVKKVLTGLDVEFETSSKGKSTIFEVDADEDALQKIRTVKWVDGVSLG